MAPKLPTQQVDEQPSGQPAAGFVAGIVAGLARVLIGHPFDTVKVLAQTGQLTSAHELAKPNFEALARLYRGVGPPMITACVTCSASFGFYEAARLGLQPFNLHTSCEIFLAGTVSGVALGLPFCPLANVRVLQQTSGEQRSVLAWLQYLRNRRGVRAWFRGLAPNLLQGGLGRGFYMATFHIVKETQTTSDQISLDSTLGKLVAASSAGIAGWVFTYPFDVVRSNIIRDWKCQRFSGALIPALVSLYSEGGIRRLYVGVGYTIVRAVPVAAVTLTTYDITKAAILRLE